MTKENFIAFDVYGTLIDTAGVTEGLQEIIGDMALAFALAWREKQLEYTFRRGLSKNYVPFSECTRQALLFVAESMGCPKVAEQAEKLMQIYSELPAFPDAKRAIKRFKDSGTHKLVAFSNGTIADVSKLLENAGLLDFFAAVISVDPIRSYKPDPAVYAFLNRVANSERFPAWLISGNPFDVIGAISYGMSAAWVKRNEKAVFDPWEIKPTATIKNLEELAGIFP